MANSDLRNKTNIRNVSYEESKNIIKNTIINTFDYVDNRKGDKDNVSFDYSKLVDYTKKDDDLIFVNTETDCIIQWVDNSEEEQRLKGLPKRSPWILSGYQWQPNKQYNIEHMGNKLYVYSDGNGSMARINKDSYPFINQMNKIKIVSYTDKTDKFYKFPVFTHTTNVVKNLISENEELKNKLESNKRTIDMLQNTVNMLNSKINIIALQLNLNI
jgi:hypothetical protein